MNQFFHLKIAIRNLRRNGVYSWINIGGLAISLIAVIFILLWVQDELSYDQFHKQSKDIYVVVSHGINDGTETYGYNTAAPLSRAAKEKIPAVKEACVVATRWDIGYLEYDNRKFFEGAYLFTDTSFFRVFDAKFIEGSPEQAFSDPRSVIITDKLAEKIFQNEPAVGKLLTANLGRQYVVSAVVKKMPENSTLQFDAIFSYGLASYRDRWDRQADRNFLLLTPGANLAAVEKSLKELPPQTDAKDNFMPFLLRPLSTYRLYNADGSEGGMKTVRLFTITAIALLTIACINYVNLVTARATKRHKELFTRNVLGAKKWQIFKQIMSEALLLFVVALAIATALIYLLNPLYNHLTGKKLVFNVFSFQTLLIYISALLPVILMAGVYPSLLLSSFNAKSWLYKAVTKRKSVFTFRRILVIAQFACAVIFIFGTIVINRQLHYMQSQSLAYKDDQVFTMEVYSNKAMLEHFQSFKTDMLQQSCIAGVSGSEQNIMAVGNFAGGIGWEGMQEGRQLMLAYYGIDRDLFSLLNIPLTSGEGFAGNPSDSSRCILNETAVKKMGIENPVGKWLDFWGTHKTVVGVVPDFHFRHMSEETPPMVILLAPECWTVYVKPEKGKIREAIAATAAIWEKYSPEFPFTYKFMDETFNEMYQSDIRTGNLFNVFAVISIFVSCLGLFGLVTFTAEAKTKEIGIRKVLGASVGSIVNMLSKEFLILVGIAMLIAFPLAYYWLDKMLQDYAYRISIGWWIFALAGIITIALTLITVGWQAIKAATANPVKSISNSE